LPVVAYDVFGVDQYALAPDPADVNTCPAVPVEPFADITVLLIVRLPEIVTLLLNVAAPV
jgi:hypothetical protein